MNLFTRVLRYAVGYKENGNRRVYIDNIEDLSDINFIPHSRFDIAEVKGEMVLTINENGRRKVIESKRGASIVELSDKEFSRFIGDEACYVSATLVENQIRIKVHHMEQQRIIREQKFKSNIKRKTVSTASLYSGTGALSYWVHKGLEKAGFKARLKFANEIDETAARINANYNPIWDTAAKDATFLVDDIETADMSLFPDYVDHVEIAQPCQPYSKLIDASKKDINHQVAGKLFIKTIQAISKMNPATLTIECTSLFSKSLAFQCITDALSKSGYSFETTELKGSDFGGIEIRNRFALFAVSKGLRGLFPSLKNISSMCYPNTVPFKAIKDEVCEQSPLWKEYNHVKKRNDMKHLGFRNVLVDDEALSMPALIASSAPKAGSPFIPHPTDNSLQRQVSVKEHTLIRKFPSKLANAIIALGEGLLPGQSRTNKAAAHRLCGNSVSPGPWETLMTYMFSGLHSSNKNQIHLGI